MLRSAHESASRKRFEVWSCCPPVLAKGNARAQNIACMMAWKVAFMRFGDSLDFNAHDAQGIDISRHAWCRIFDRRKARSARFAQLVERPLYAARNNNDENGFIGCFDSVRVATVVARWFTLCYDLSVSRYCVAIYPARFLRQQVPGLLVYAAHIKQSCRADCADCADGRQVRPLASKAAHPISRAWATAQRPCHCKLPRGTCYPT